jgi:hypothetical protein
MNQRAKDELTRIWTDGYATVATLIVVIPLIIYTLNRFGFFDCFNAESWADIKYIVTGPLFFLIGVTYAPVWITCAIYLVFLIFKLIFTIIRILYMAADNIGKPKTVSRKDMINKLKQNS